VHDYSAAGTLCGKAAEKKGRLNNSLAMCQCRSVNELQDIKKGYVTDKWGNVPKVALSKLSGDKILLASSIQRQPR